MTLDADAAAQPTDPLAELTPERPGTLADAVITAADLSEPATAATIALPRPLGIFGPGGPARRTAATAVGLILLGIGVGCHISSDLGAAALDAAGVGIAAAVGIAPGWGSSILVALLVCGATLAGQRPGIGTLGVIFGVAPVVNATVDVLGAPQHWWGAAALWALGMICVAVGSALLVAARLGAASLEMATLALAHRRVAGRTVGIVAARWGIEAAFLALGFALGGAIGVGTVAFAVLVGPALRLTIPATSQLVFGAAEPAPATTQ